MKTCLTALIAAIFSFSGIHLIAQTSNGLNAVIWKGIGGKTKWDSTNYILFTANGNGSKHVQNGRKFLINKRSGQVRFEGKMEDGNNIVSLFNFKTGKLSRFFSNGEEAKESNTDVNNLCSRIYEQFKKDVSFIFLPAFIDNPTTRTGSVSSKIVNAEKLKTLTFQLNNGLSGEVFVSPETGYIKQMVDKEGNAYFVNGYKDIGGGLILPTSFKCLSDSVRSASFTTVAAFTEMEESKFTGL